MSAWPLFVGMIIMIVLAGVAAWQDHSSRWRQLGIRRRKP